MPLAMSGLTRGVNGRHQSETTAFHPTEARRLAIGNDRYGRTACHCGRSQRTTAWGRRRSILYDAGIGGSGYKPDIRTRFLREFCQRATEARSPSDCSRTLIRRLVGGGVYSPHQAPQFFLRVGAAPGAPEIERRHDREWVNEQHSIKIRPLCRPHSSERCNTASIPEPGV